MCVLFFLGGGGGEGKTREVKASAIFFSFIPEKGTSDRRSHINLLPVLLSFFAVLFFFSICILSGKEYTFFTLTKTLGYGVSLRHSRISA